MIAKTRLACLPRVFAWLSMLSLTSFLASAAESAPEKARPNVLFIVVDDLGTSLGCYGNAEVKSPSIDRLAARGMRFDRAYCQYPMCNPSRTSFLTGMRPDTTGILDNNTPFRTRWPDVVTLPQLFRQQGYDTTSLGKIIHMGLDPAGKPEFFQDAKSWVECRSFTATKTGLRGEGRNLTGGKIPAIHWVAAEGGELDQPDGQLAAEAIRQIEERRDAPFFLALGFHKPHDPFNAPKAYFDLYPLDQIRLPSAPDNRTADLPPAIPRGSPLAALAEREAKELKRAYLAGLSFMDAQLGKVLDALDQRKLWETTIVVFLGDHGYHLGEHGWWNKVTVFELCARPPLIVWAPGAKGMGHSTAGLVEYIDLYPTIADFCGLQPPSGLQGKSFRPLLDDPALPGKAAAYTQVVRGKFMGRSVRTDRWRYTEWDRGAQGVELYDHADDALEYHNLANDPGHAATLAEMKKILHEVMP